MTRRIDEFEQPLDGGHYAARWKDRVPSNLGEWDREQERSDRLRELAAERASKRGRPC